MVIHCEPTESKIQDIPLEPVSTTVPDYEAITDQRANQIPDNVSMVKPETSVSIHVH